MQSKVIIIGKFYAKLKILNSRYEEVKSLNKVSAFKALPKTGERASRLIEAIGIFNQNGCTMVHWIKGKL